jgi:3-oxoacyl-[acyl-carrier protein] reductase
MDLAGKVALVTGANRGVGAGCAAKLAARGAKVGVHYFSDRARADEVAAGIGERGGAALAVQADVSDAASVGRMVAECAEAFGPIDILVNGARQLGVKKPFLDLDWADYETQIDTILKGAFNCCQAVLGPMMERKVGRIINISTTVLGEPDWRWHTYGAAKGALHLMTRNLAAEMGPYAITVNEVSPGFVPTDRGTPHGEAYRAAFLAATPMGRFGTPEEIADTVAFLASDDARFITGANIAVCGGKVMY